jgi:hypothetical protein
MCVLLLSGCDAFSTLKDGFAQSQAAAKALEEKTGHKAFVGFNWNNGTLTNVSITFDAIITEKSLKDVESLTREVVKSSFKQEARQITLAFVVKKDGS